MNNTNPTDNMWGAFVALEAAIEAEELEAPAGSPEGATLKELLRLCAKLSKVLGQVEDSLLDALEEAKPPVQAPPAWMQLNAWLTTLAMARAEEPGVCERVDLEQVSGFLEQFRPS